MPRDTWQVNTLESEAAAAEHRIDDLEEKLRKEVAAGEERAQSFRDDLEAAAARVDSLAGMLSVCCPFCCVPASAGLMCRRTYVVCEIVQLVMCAAALSEAQLIAGSTNGGGSRPLATPQSAAASPLPPTTTPTRAIDAAAAGRPAESARDYSSGGGADEKTKDEYYAAAAAKVAQELAMHRQQWAET